MEITIISAQGLKKMSTLSPFSSHRRLRPFVTVSIYPKTTSSHEDRSINKKGYVTRIDDKGGVNPTWGDKFVIPVDASFSCIYLELYTKRLLSGRAQLGWCQIPVTDFGFSQAGCLRYLSYRVRDHRDGTRGQGILNIAVRTRPQTVVGRRESVKSGEMKDSGSFSGTVIGIPVEMISNMRICQ
ncbi:BON1-associated protein 2 [Linum perenne]